jgi:tetratricopeptide (TPR) repeat protein
MFLKRFFKFVPKNEFSRALDLFNDGHHKKAMRIFEELLARHGGDQELDIETVELYACECHVALSKERLNEGKREEAIAEMERAVTFKPNFADLRYTLGGLLFDASRAADAREQFEQALRINPKFFKAKISLARTDFATGERDRTVEVLESARADCPSFYRENVEHLVQMIRTGEESTPIEQAFREVLEDRPSSAQVRREVAIQAIQNGDYAEAIRELKKAIAVNADYPDLHNYLGIAYGNSGMADDAVEEFETALKINPYYLKARLNLALALYDQGCYAEAQNHIERVLTVQPENQLARNLLAEVKIVSDRK